MSYKGFKKVSQDAKTTTFQHPNGSELKVAHGHISPALKKQLDSLPMHLAEGGGADDDSKFTFTGDDRPYTMASDGDQAYGTPPTSGSAMSMPTANSGIQVNPMGSATIGATSPQQLGAVSQSVPPESPRDPGSEDDVSDSGVAAQTPSAPAPQAPQYPGSYLTQPQPATTTMQQLNQEYAAMKQDFASGQIKPETYHDLFASKDTLGKVGTLFGLLISGAGSGLAHQPNAVMEMMNKQIDRDLEAQKATKGNQLNALTLADGHLRNLSEISLRGTQQAQMGAQTKLTGAQTQEAQANAALTRLNVAKTSMLLGAYQNLAGQVSNIPPGPQRQAAEGALNTVQSGIDSHVGQMNAQTAQQIEANWQRKNAGMNLLSPEIAKYQSERHVPGVGEASVPVSGEDREALQSGQAFDQKLQRFIDWSKGHSETAALHPVDRRVGETLAAELQGAYRQATHGGVYKEGEQNFISKLIASDPVGNLNKFTVVPQLEALQKENQERVSQKAQSLGLPGYSPQPQAGDQSQGMTDKKGNAIVMIGGKPYRKKAQ